MKPATEQTLLLEVRDLRTYFPLRRGVLSKLWAYVRAVDGVSFSVARGRTLGLVGESGCGKTTVGRTVLRLIPATSGRAIFDGVDLFAESGQRLRRLRRRMQIVFQDPGGSLSPRKTVENIVAEPLAVHRLVPVRQRRQRVAALLREVGLGAELMCCYPHELSGGQRQRVAIARAISLEPDLIILDEPVSALDVSIQAQIVNLLGRLQRERGLSYLFIAHDPALVRHACSEVAVMYLGKIVEIGPAEDVFSNPKHPYTQLLLLSAPDPFASGGVGGGSRYVPSGEPPSPVNPPAGCAFHPRCPLAEGDCCTCGPRLRRAPGCAVRHTVACHLAERITPASVSDALAGKSRPAGAS